MPIGSPWSSPSGSPAMTAASAFAASARARSELRVTMALTVASMASIRGDAGVGQFDGRDFLAADHPAQGYGVSSHRSLVLIPVGFLVSSPGD